MSILRFFLYSHKLHKHTDACMYACVRRTKISIWNEYLYQIKMQSDQRQLTIMMEGYMRKGEK